jgi:protoheme IX farnesyltransferase
MSAGTRQALGVPAQRGVSATLVARARAFAMLTRPNVSLLVGLTAPPAVLLGARPAGMPHALVTALAGTLLLSAGCSAVNAWHERALDARMARTRRRPLPAGELSAGEALAFGLFLSVSGVAVLAAWGSALAGLLGLITFAWYIGVYTIWSKPRTAHSTVIGAIAGAAAPLLADAAAHGRVGPWGATLSLMVFLWQPPHVWSIALFRRHDYAAAGLPMMPAVVGDRTVRRWMLAWALVLLPVSLLPWWAGVLGPVYAVTALAAGLVFVVAIGRSMRDGHARSDRRVFAASLLHLMLVFGAMLVELACAPRPA